MCLISSPLSAKNSSVFSKIKIYKHKQRHLSIEAENSFQNALYRVVMDLLAKKFWTNEKLRSVFKIAFFQNLSCFHFTVINSLSPEF